MRETLVKTEEFKDSPLGLIPKDWRISRFGDLVASLTLGTTTRGVSEIDRNVPLIKMGNLGWGELLLEDVEWVNKNSVLGIATVTLQYRDFLFNTRNTPELVGKTAIWRNHLPEAIHDNNILRVRFKAGIASPFVCAYMSSGIGKDRVHALSTGTTSVAAIYWKHLENYLLPVPPEPEQEKIIEIIEIIDQTISHTSSLIAKLKQMKAGLLHDLLTWGLDENGELRDAITHPEQFKDSQLGQIPKEWDVLEVNQVSEDITYGLTVRPQYVPQGIPLISAKECFDGWIDYENANKISEVDYRALRLRSIPKPGDVLFTKTGTVGRVARIKLNEPKCAISQNVALIKPRPDIVTAEFLELSLKSESIRRQTAVGITTLSIPDLQLAVIGRFLLPIPPKPEQSEIVICINSHDSRIRTEEAYRDKLKLQKQGLMNDLLTGKVRIKDA